MSTKILCLFVNGRLPIPLVNPCAQKLQTNPLTLNVKVSVCPYKNPTNNNIVNNLLMNALPTVTAFAVTVFTIAWRIVIY